MSLMHIFVSKSVDISFGLNRHMQMWAPLPKPVPTPVPSLEMVAFNFWPPGVLLNTVKLTKTVKHQGFTIAQGGTDCGPLVFDLSLPPPNQWYPIMWIFSSRSIIFQASAVQMEANPTACAQSYLLPLWMMTCGDPAGLPTAFFVSSFTSTLKVKMSIFDLIMGVVKIALSIAIDLIFDKIGGGGKAGKEAAEKAAKEAAEKAGKEVGEKVAKEALEKATKEAAEKAAKEATEKAAKEAAEKAAKEAAEKAQKEAVEKAAKGLGDEAGKKALAKQLAEEAFQKVAAKEIAEKAAKEAAEKAAKEAAEKAAKEAAEKAAKEAAEKAAKEAGEKASKEATEKAGKAKGWRDKWMGFPADKAGKKQFRDGFKDKLIPNKTEMAKIATTSATGFVVSSIEGSPTLGVKVGVVGAEFKTPSFVPGVPGRAPGTEADSWGGGVSIPGAGYEGDSKKGHKGTFPWGTEV